MLYKYFTEKLLVLQDVDIEKLKKLIIQSILTAD